MITRYLANGRLSRAVIHNRCAHLGGQLSLNGGDIREQTRETLAKVDAVLEGLGTDKSRVLSVTIWLKDMADFGAMNAEWDAWVDASNPPARATVEARLVSEDVLVEMMVVAAV